MNRLDIERLDLTVGEPVRLRTSSKDGVERKPGGLTVVAYDIPVGCIGAYYPEANVLLPIWHYADGSKVPAANSIPVMIHRETEKVASVTAVY